MPELAEMGWRMERMVAELDWEEVVEDHNNIITHRFVLKYLNLIRKQNSFLFLLNFFNQNVLQGNTKQIF